MAYRTLLLVIAFAASAYAQNFGRSFGPSFGSRLIGGDAFRAPNSISFTPGSPRLPLAIQPVTFNTIPSSQDLFFSASGSANVNRIRRPRVPPSRNFGINFQGLSVAKEPSFITFGTPQENPVLSSSNKDETTNPSGASSPVSVSNKNVARFPHVNIGAEIMFGNDDGTPLPPSGPVISSPRLPAIGTSSNLPETAPSSFPVTSAPGNQAAADNSSVVLFPTQPVVTNKNVNNNGGCLLEHGLILFDGKCSRLLSRGSCGSDQWLVQSDDGIPHCADRACPWEQLAFQGDCVDPANFDVCPRGQILYIDFNGQAECDCEANHYYDPDSGYCYTYHEQGPCQSAFYLEPRQGGGVDCVPNPCENDDKVLVNGECHDKNYKGFCEQELVTILPENNTADCMFVVPHSIFDVPALKACPEGSLRDFLGNCRAVFRVPTQTSLPSLRGDCPKGFVADPSGTCRKVISLFG